MDDGAGTHYGVATRQAYEAWSREDTRRTCRSLQ
jgi:hypothetical protein